MSVLGWLRGRTPKLTDGAFWSAYYGKESWSGKAVTPDSALQLATVFASVRLTSQAIASFPLPVYQTDASGGRKPIDTPLSVLMQDSPNDDQTPAEFWESTVAWMLVNGNAYSEKRFMGDRLVALEPLPSDQTMPFRDSNRELKYRFTDRGKVEVLPPEKVFHLKGFSFGGDVAPSIIRYGAQTFGSAIATDEAAAKVFANGLQAAALLTSQVVLTPEKRAEYQKILEAFVGSSNAGKVMLAEGGIDVKPLTLKPEDAEMLASRRFAIEEICRWFGIPPIIVGHAAEGQTMWGSGVEQIWTAWLTLGLNPLMRRIEQRIRKSLTSPAERARGVYAEFNREGLLQADSKSKAEFLSSLTQNGLMTRNEGRGKLNLPKMPGGDQLTVQSALMPLELLGKVPPARVQPKPGDPIPEPQQ